MNNYASYKIVIEKKAQKFLKQLTKPCYTKIVSKIKALRVDTSLLNIKKLQGYKNLYRIRVDNYRIIFAVLSDKQIIAIALIAHRREVYSALNKTNY